MIRGRPNRYTFAALSDLRIQANSCWWHIYSIFCHLNEGSLYFQKEFAFYLAIIERELCIAR